MPVERRWSAAQKIAIISVWMLTTDAEKKKIIMSREKHKHGGAVTTNWRWEQVETNRVRRGLGVQSKLWIWSFGRLGRSSTEVVQFIYPSFIHPSSTNHPSIIRPLQTW